MNPTFKSLLVKKSGNLVWVMLGLFVFAGGCTGQQPEKTPATTSSSTDHAKHAEHGMPSNEVDTQHGNHDSHENMPMTALTQRKLLVESEPAQPVAGLSTKLLLRISDDDGKPIKQFDIVHTKMVHLIVVREGLDEFAHLHPTVVESGTITIAYTFPKSGTYRLFADHQPQRMPPGLATGEIVVIGDDEPATPLASSISNDVAVGEIKARVTINPGEREIIVRFHILNAAGESVGDLQPYLGAMGHLVIISEDGRDYVHAHPLGDANSAPDGIIEFAAHFPKPGMYKMWGQFQRDGQVVTVPFVLDYNRNNDH